MPCRREANQVLLQYAESLGVIGSQAGTLGGLVYREIWEYTICPPES